MRVTNAGSASLALAAMSKTSERVAEVQAQIASQRKITRPSDDPAGAAAALSLRSATARDVAFQRSTSDALGRLGTIDSTLGSATEQLQRAQDLVRQGLNTGTLDSGAQAALADQIQNARANLLALANTTDGSGRPLFGGTAGSGAAFAADGSYLGTDGVPSRLVAEGTSVPVGAVGGAVFGSGADSVFAGLDAAAAAVRSGDVDGARTALDRIDAGVTAVSRARSQAGATSARITATSDAAATARVGTAAALSALQDVDVAQVSIDLSSAQFAYQVSLQVAAGTHQTSLLDFLR